MYHPKMFKNITRKNTEVTPINQNMKNFFFQKLLSFPVPAGFAGVKPSALGQ
jgi:hypothetical protein